MSDNKRRETAALARKALLLVTFLGAAAIMFMGLFWVRESDLAGARDEILREKSTSSHNTASLMPKITREHFEFKEPVPGEKGKYRWRVSGGESVSISPTVDRIEEFAGEVVDGGDRIKLSAPVATFDKDKQQRILSCPDGVITEIHIANVSPSESAAAAPSPGGNADPAKTASGKPKEEKKKRSPLIITSDTFIVDLKKETRASPPKGGEKKAEPPPLAVYIGNVVARDDNGIIYADKMEVWVYSEEDKKKNPKLKGIKTVRCTGDVKIDQPKGQKQARCAVAVYDAKANIIHLHGDPKTGKKVVYRDEADMTQIKALELIFDRNKDEIIFKHGVETIDFNPERKSFLGFMEPEQTPQGGGRKPQPGG